MKMLSGIMENYLKFPLKVKSWLGIIVDYSRDYTVLNGM